MLSNSLTVFDHGLFSHLLFFVFFFVQSIAIEYGGAKVLSRLLCEDPSCHLLAIILVNLTFADGDLRRELVSPVRDVQLVEALSYALLVSSFISLINLRCIYFGSISCIF